MKKILTVLIATLAVIATSHAQSLPKLGASWNWECGTGKTYAAPTYRLGSLTDVFRKGWNVDVLGFVGATEDVPLGFVAGTSLRVSNEIDLFLGAYVKGDLVNWSGISTGINVGFTFRGFAQKAEPSRIRVVWIGDVPRL